MLGLIGGMTLGNGLDPVTPGELLLGDPAPG